MPPIGHPRSRKTWLRAASLGAVGGLRAETRLLARAITEHDLLGRLAELTLAGARTPSSASESGSNGTSSLPSASSLLPAYSVAYAPANRLAELSLASAVNSQPTTVTCAKHYIWGNDLSGNLHGAGGVGGLLSMVISSLSPVTSQLSTDRYFYAYDGNGNVRALVKADSATPAASAVVERYAYDGFGRELAGSGSVGSNNSQLSPINSSINSFRFSTKYLDAETGMNYYGYRFYAAYAGRWISRDPIEEKGGWNVYGMVGNGVIDKWDVNGLIDAYWVATQGYGSQHMTVELKVSGLLFKQFDADGSRNDLSIYTTPQPWASGTVENAASGATLHSYISGMTNNGYYSFTSEAQLSGERRATGYVKATEKCEEGKSAIVRVTGTAITKLSLDHIRTMNSDALAEVRLPSPLTPVFALHSNIAGEEKTGTVDVLIDVTLGKIGVPVMVASTMVGLTWKDDGSKQITGEASLDVTMYPRVNL